MEYELAGAILLVALALRVAYVFTYRIDTDEPQHLHVVWAWTQGLLPYRDVFDNHTPLFHMLMTPIAAAIGEHADIVAWMRIAMIPISAFTLWCTYMIGRAVFEERVGVWAAVWLAVCPRFFLTSVEFRADTLWAALWLAALAVLMGGGIEPGRGFAAGLLLGADLAVSMKTTLCLMALAIAAAVVLLVVRRPRKIGAAALGRFAGATLVGFLIVPAAVTLWFASKGALAFMVYGTITHNVVPGVAFGLGWGMRLLVLSAFVPFCWLGVWMCKASAPSAGDGARRIALFLCGMAYVAILESVWPLETKQDYQVCLPILLIFVAAVGVSATRTIVASRAGLRAHAARMPAAFATVALIEIAALLYLAPVVAARIRVDPYLIADVLRLTRPADPVMDLKGETVFRSRPFHYVLETLTRKRMSRGLLADTIPERLIATRTCVAVADSDRFPPRGREFLLNHYLPVGRLRVAGRMLTDGDSRAPTGIVFHVRIPAPYVIASANGPAQGELDGRGYDGARFLAAGRHVFRTRRDEGQLALVWAPALERGFSPFSPLASLS